MDSTFKFKKNKITRSNYMNDDSFGDIIYIKENKQNNITNIEELEHKYCHKCYQKRKSQESISKIDIFNKINYIIFNSMSMPDVYNKMDNLIFPFNKWLESNEDGYSVFHWFAWFISTKIKKYQHIKPKVYAFFQKVFSDNTIESIFTKKQIASIVSLTHTKFQNHTILYHLVRYCENPNDIYYKRLYNLLIENGCPELSNSDLLDIQNINTEEDKLPNELKTHVSEITYNYKNIEELIIKNLETKCSDYELTKCIECNSLIDYTKEIPKIITYATEKKYDSIINLIWFAYYQRKLLNKVFDNYYKLTNSCSNLNQIHKRHSHILDIYANSLF